MSLLRWSAAALIAAFEMCSSAPSMAEADPMCAGRKDCRPLTSSETKFAKTIFGNGIDYAKVRIVNVPSFLIAIYADATAHGSRVHFHDRDLLSDDHARKSPSNRMILIHELTHVWQHQHGIDVRGMGLALALKYPMNYKKAYKYALDKPFTEYNMEQQAKIVEHYALAREAYRVLKTALPESTGEKHRKIKEDMKTACAAMAARYVILESYLPLAPHKCNHALN